MQGFLPIPALEAPADGYAFVFSAARGRPAWTNALAMATITASQNVAFGSAASLDSRYVVSILDTHTAADSVYRGLEIVTTHQGAVGSASTGIDVIHSTSGSNNMDHIVGAQIRPAHGSTGTLAAATGVFSRIDVSTGAGAITDLKLFYGFNGTFTGTAPVNNYGLYLENITGGSSLNYAIFTGTGLVKLGDTTDASSSTVGGVVMSGGLAVAKKLYTGDTTDASSSSVASVVLAGGLAVAKKLYTGDTTAASAVGTASVVFAGGISAAKDCYFGGQVVAKTTDSGTATQATTWVNNHKSTGTPAAFFGTAYRWRSSSTTTDDRDQGVLLCYWTDATDATRKAALDWYVYDTTSRSYLYVAADGARANMQFLGAGAAGQFGGGSGVIGLANCTTAPTSSPTGGGVLYAEAGALKWKGSSGTVTTIAAA